AIISVAAGLASVLRVAEGHDLTTFIGELGNAAKDPKNKTKLEQDVAQIKGLGGDIKDLVSSTKALISFVKVSSALDSASSAPGQGQTGKLLREKAKLTRDRMVASMRERQAQARVAAAQRRVTNLATEMAAIDDKLAHWSAEAAALGVAVDLLIPAARQMVHMVMEAGFLAPRAPVTCQL